MTSSVFLIVVDNPAHRLLFNRYLQTTPHHLVFAGDGEDGFDRYNEVKPDLVLIDVDVAKLEGTIVVQLIRQQPNGSTTPIVMLASGDTNRDLEWARSIGADALLDMPFERTALLAEVAPLLTAGRPPPPAPKAAPPTLERMTPPDDTEVLGRPLVDDETPLDVASGPRPPSSSGEHDMDTVVSFQNPFYEANGVALVDPAIGERELPTPRTANHHAPAAEASQATVELRNAEPITSIDAPATDPAAPTSGEVRREPSIIQHEDNTDFVPRVSPERDPTPIADRSPPSGIPLVQLVDDEETSPPDPLEEPRISPAMGSTPDISKSALIEEVPREGTPSSSDGQRISAIRQRAHGKERRGLDESQLGKRLAKRVRKMHGMLEEVDYYQLLGLERHAAQPALETAYFDLSLEFHPDRFFLLRSGDLKEKIYMIYRRIHEAFRVLSDPRRRKPYDQMLADRSAKRASPDMRDEADAEQNGASRTSKGLDVEAKTTLARPFVERAQAAFQLGDFNAARMHLTLARSYEGENGSIHAAIAHVETHLTPTV